MWRSLARRARPLANHALQALQQCDAATTAQRGLQTRSTPGLCSVARGGLQKDMDMGCLSRTSRAFSSTPPPADYGSAVGEPAEIERLPLPPGVSGDKFGLYEVHGTAKDWREVSGDNAVVAVHGPEELWVPAPGNPGASGGMFAVIAAGGTQHKVSGDDVLYINRIKGDINEQVIFDEVLLVGAYDWSLFGRPLIRTASVLATIEEQSLTSKVMVTKFKKRKGYTRRKGHRQPVTRLRIEEIRFEFPTAEEITPYEVRYDPRRPPLPSHTRWF